MIYFIGVNRRTHKEKKFSLEYEEAVKMLLHISHQKIIVNRIEIYGSNKVNELQKLATIFSPEFLYPIENPNGIDNAYQIVYVPKKDRIRTKIFNRKIIDRYVKRIAKDFPNANVEIKYEKDAFTITIITAEGFTLNFTGDFEFNIKCQEIELMLEYQKYINKMFKNQRYYSKIKGASKNA